MADLVMVGAGPQALSLSCLLLQKRSRLQRRLRPGERILADRIWLATGHRHGVSQQPLLQQLYEQHPIELVDDWPVLGPDLGWPGTLVHLMGGLSALQVGPAARNLFVGREAAQRICRAVIKH